MGLMKAGRMDQQILIQRATYAVDAAGTPTPAWADMATVWAQVIQRSTKEAIAAEGAARKADLMAFRVRFLDGVTAADRVMFGGRALDIIEIASMRRDGLMDMHCVSPIWQGLA